MGKSKGLVALALLAMAICLVFTGCNQFGLDNGPVQYGSLTVADDSSRSINADEIKSAVATVTGFDCNGDSFTRTSGVVAVSGGSAKGIKIDKIPYSKNAVIKVQAYSDADATSIIDGVTIYNTVDVNSESASVSVNQSTSRKGCVYAQLIASNVDTNALSSDKIASINSAIPENVNYSLIKASSIVADYKANSLKTSDNYVYTPAAVTVSSDNASGYKVYISDQNSSKATLSTSDTDFEVAPGSWTIYVIDSDGNVVASKGITFGDAGSADITVSKTTASSTDLTGKTILFVKAETAPTVWAWETSGSSVALSEKLEQSWNEQPKMSVVTSDYMSDCTGWYMSDFSSVASGGNISFILNKGSTVTTEKSGCIWYDNSVSDENPSPSTADGEETVSINVTSINAGTSTGGSGSGSGSGSSTITDKIIVHAKSANYKAIYVFDSGTSIDKTGPLAMTDEENGWMSYTINATKASIIFTGAASSWNGQTGDLAVSAAGEYWYNGGKFCDYNPEDTVAPALVSFTSDNSGTASGTVTFTVSATDDKNLSKAELTLDGKSFASVTLSGTSCTGTYKWDTTAIQNGTYTIGCTVYDTAKNSASASAISITTKNANLPPVAVISGAKMPAVDKEITYKAASSYDQNGGTIESYKWTLTGSGATITSGAATDTLKVKTSSTEGAAFTLSLTVTDNDGASSDAVTLSCTTAAVDANWDFRDETIYFLITTRFYDGDETNNRYCWGDEVNLKSKTNKDPGWRGDFKGLIEKLDYIKALGFTAIWITPVVENASDLDYHGYHATDFSKVDPRYESDGVDYQDLIDACHAKGLKVIQDIVLNHCSNAGEKNLLPMTVKDYASDNNVDCVPMKVDHNAKDIYGRNTYELLNQGVIAVTNGNFSTYEALSNDTTLSDDVRGGYMYNARIYSMNNGLAVDNEEVGKMFHYCPSFSQWESYDVQVGTMAGDCVDLNTENPKVAEYLRKCYINYINMGVDAFRIDTLKHISRLTMNNEFIPQFHAAAKAAGNDKFYMFGEACVKRCDIFNADLPGISVCFYTWNQNQTTLDSSYPWKGTDDYIAGAKDNLAQCKIHFDAQSVGNQCTSTNAFLNDSMTYHTPDYSKASGLNVIDFRMHHQFLNASQAYSCGLEEDQYFNDSTWNVTYVDSHDYGPNTILGVRYDQGEEAWAENLDLMFTFRGIPCVYYGSEVEFQAGKQIEPWYNGCRVPYNESGRAYYGDYLEGSVTANGAGDYTASGTVKETLSKPLCQHLMRLNQIRAAVPALRKGQYKSFDNMKFVRRYTDNSVDSVAVVSISGSGTFSGLPNGKYIDVVSGAVQNVTNGTLTTSNSGKGSMSVYVNATLDPSITGKIGESGTYLK